MQPLFPLTPQITASPAKALHALGRSVGVALSVALLTLGCGSETKPNSGGGGISCGVGETVALDSQGNKFCQKAGGGGTVTDQDAGGVLDSGAATDSGASGGVDTAGGTADTGSAPADTSGGTVDAGPTTGWWACPPVKKASGLEHGKACTKDEDCLYSQCVTGGPLTGYDDTIKYCTKNNACAGGESATSAPCGADDGQPAGVVYKTVFEKTKSGGNPKRDGKTPPLKVCARTCKTDADCLSWNSQLPDCIINSTKYVSVGTQGVCGKNPFK